MGWKTGCEYTPPKCFICGEKPAIMGSTRWRPYEGEACSDACGLEAKARIEGWMRSDQYKNIMRRLTGAQNDLRLSEVSALGNTSKEEGQS